MACEILTCEVDVIFKTLVEEEEVGPTDIKFHTPWSYYGIRRHAYLTLKFMFSFSFCSNLQLMDLLFSFLEPTRPHSALLAGYFSKVYYKDHFSRLLIFYRYIFIMKLSVPCCRLLYVSWCGRRSHLWTTFKWVQSYWFSNCFLIFFFHFISL